MPKKKVVPPRANDFRIAAYARVSSQRQATEGDSLEAQQHEISKYVEHKKSLQSWQVQSLQLYVDAGRSAKDQNRPQLQQLKRDIEEGRIDLVICFKLDRITRSLLDFVELWSLFNKHGVRVVSLREDFDTSSIMGEAMLKLVMIFAELERKLTAERTLATMKDRVDRGLWNGGYVYGYVSDPKEPGRLVPEPEWAAKIRTHFFDAFEELGSVGAVVRRLRQIGLLTPEYTSRAGRTHAPKPFDKQQVKRILTNPIYIGKNRWGEQVKDNNHEPIISPEQFQRIARKIGENVSRRSNHRYTRGLGYPLKGLVRCGCGAMMTPTSCMGRNRTFRYYRCTKQVHGGGPAACRAALIPAEPLEQALLERIRHLGASKEVRDRVVCEALRLVDDGSQRIESEIAAARQRLGAGQAEINNLVGVLKQQGQGGMASVQDELARLEAEQTQLRESLKGLTEANRPLDAASAAARQFLETWESVGQLLEQATQNELRTILEHYIEVVELRPAPEDPKRGTYVLKLFPELRPLGDPSLIKENGTPVASLDRGAVLTDTALVCGAVEKAPRQGLEP